VNVSEGSKAASETAAIAYRPLLADGRAAFATLVTGIRTIAAAGLAR